MVGKRDRQLEDDVPSSYLDRFDSVTRESWRHDDFRKRILEITKEHEKSSDFRASVRAELSEFVRTEGFINKCKEISSKEVKDYVDKSRTKTIFWVAGLIVAAGAAAIAQKAFNFL